MIFFQPIPQPDQLVKVSGKIANYRVVRQSASFVFTEGDQTRLGAVAIATSLAGMAPRRSLSRAMQLPWKTKLTTYN